MEYVLANLEGSNFPGLSAPAMAAPGMVGSPKSLY